MPMLVFGAEGEIRTLTPFRTLNLETSASTIPPLPHSLVPQAGVEPARHFWHLVLSEACLLFHHQGIVWCRK